jgi:hypothetical protein
MVMTPRPTPTLIGELESLNCKLDILIPVLQRIDRALGCGGPGPEAMSLAASLTINETTGVVTNMSGSNTITLTNAANPALATRYLGVIDITNDVSDVPNVVVSDPTKLTSVVGTLTPASGSTPSQVLVGFYPIDTNAEANDSVSATLSLSDGSTIPLSFSISGTPSEQESLDPASAVGSWVGAPTVPTTPT